MPPLASMLVFSSSGVLLVHRPPLVETHLVLGMEHSDLASDATTGQYVGLLVESEGCPGQSVEVLLDVLVLVLHEHGPRVDVDDAYAVAATGGHVRGGLVVVLRVWLEDNLPNLSLDIGWVVVLGMRPDKVDWVIVEVVLLIARLLFLLPLNPFVGGRTVRLGSLLVRHHPI